MTDNITQEIDTLTRKLRQSETVGYGYDARRKAIQARIDELRVREAEAEMKDAG